MTLKFEGLKAERNFHAEINLVLSSKVRKYENKYRTKICDFTACILASSTPRHHGSGRTKWVIPLSPCGGWRIFQLSFPSLYLFLLLLQNCKTCTRSLWIYQIKELRSAERQHHTKQVAAVKLQIFVRYPFSFFCLETGSYELIFVLSKASK